MDLWIRSQNKHILAKYDRFAVAQVTPKTQAEVMAFISDDFGYEKLGAYKTKERALEVLDEIQQILQNGFVVCKECEDMLIKGAITPNNSTTIVYEMPKE